jgi:phosphoglycolate phosphatase
MNIFFDLDGTLINSKIRLFNLFQDLVPQSNFTFEEYWNLKKQKINHKDILINYFNFNDSQINHFQNKWMELIESETYLKFDIPFKGTTEYFLDLKQKGYLLYVVTARQLKEKAAEQIASFGWAKIFAEILVTEQKNTKESLIFPYLNDKANSYMVGDTGSDVNVGKKLNIKTVAVLSGFLSEKVLKTYKPDYTFKNIIDFKPNLLSSNS